MRKYLFFLLAVSLFLSATGLVFAQDVPVESKIVKVTVYPDSALLTRLAQVKLEPGTYQVVFTDIIPSLDENSIRVSGTGSAKVLGAQVKKEYLAEKPAEKVQKIEKEIEGLMDERKKLGDMKELAETEKEWLNSLKFFSSEQLPKDLVTKVPASKDLGDLLKFMDESLKDNYAASLDLELKTRELDKKIEVLRKGLAEIATPNRSKRSVAVDVEVLKAGTLDIMLSYRVFGATWQPIYDARAIFEKSQTELVAYGVVRQSTGEDWNDVEVVLSTAKPSISGRMPDLASWFLAPFQRIVRTQQYEPYYMAGKDADMQLAAGASSLALEKKELAAPAAPLKVAYAVAEQKGVSVTYKIPRKATIASDGSEVRLPVFSQGLASKFKYSAFPRLSDFAYLASEVKNAKELQLPAGRVNVFLGDDFVGMSGINTIGPGETFDLYLGADENVKVKREEIEHKMDDVLLANIPSPNRKVTLKYKLSVENYKNTKITFELFEAVPVSQDERIKVKIDQVSSEPKVKNYKDKQGIWRWEFELEPQAKKEIYYTCIVEYPRNMQVEGL